MGLISELEQLFREIHTRKDKVMDLFKLKEEEFNYLISHGSEEEVEKSRDECLAAYEAVLDTKIELTKKLEILKRKAHDQQRDD